MLVGAAALFLLIRRYGETLTAPPPAATAVAAGAAAGAGAPTVLFHVLLILTAIVVAGRLLGRLFTSLRQPPVIGEVVAGILLGPSLLGRVAPELGAYLL